MSNGTMLMCFPGQGSQSVGMLASIASKENSIKQCYQEASDALNINLWELVSEGSAEQLQLTENAQPALLVAGVALYRLWSARGGMKPQWLAGHSLGECTALVCANSMSFTDGVKLVRERGRLMQDAVPVGEGVMYAVLGLGAKEVERVCAEYKNAQETVELVNYNSPEQSVIAGHKEATKRASERCLESGARRVVPIPVSVPFHTSLMRKMSDSFSAFLENIQLNVPQIPVIHNVHAQPENDSAKIKELLVRQLYSPVRWIECVEYAVHAGATLAIECGPGKVLCGLNKRISKTLDNRALDPADHFEATLDFIRTQ